MSRDAYLRREAREDLETAATWYEERRSGLGSEFIDTFLACIERIESNPEMYPLVDAGIHRALLRRFPYAIYYFLEQRHIEVLGILHCNQHPGSWRSRT